MIIIWNIIVNDYNIIIWNIIVNDYDIKIWNIIINDYDMIIWNIIINDYNIVIWNVIVNDYNMEYTHQYHNHLIKRSFRLILSATKYKSVTLEARRGEIAVCQ